MKRRKRSRRKRGKTWPARVAARSASECAAECVAGASRKLMRINKSSGVMYMCVRLRPTYIEVGGVSLSRNASRNGEQRAAAAAALLPHVQEHSGCSAEMGKLRGKSLLGNCGPAAAVVPGMHSTLNRTAL